MEAPDPADHAVPVRKVWPQRGKMVRLTSDGLQAVLAAAVTCPVGRVRYLGDG